MMWRLREPLPADVGFIFNSWLKSLRDAPAYGNLTHTVYYQEAHRCMERILTSPNCRAVVACAPGEDDQDMIFGYGVGETLPTGEFIIHYIYVKHAFRAFGMGKALEAELLKNPHATVSFSTWTKLTHKLLKDRPYLFNPFRFWSR